MGEDDLPFMSLPVAQWLADSVELTAEETGVLIRAYCHAWRRGGYLPANAAVVARMLGIAETDWPRIRAVLARWIKTHPDGGGFVIPEVREEYARAIALRDAKRRGAHTANSNRWKGKSDSGSQSASHSGSQSASHSDSDSVSPSYSSSSSSLSPSPSRSVHVYASESVPEARARASTATEKLKPGQLGPKALEAVRLLLEGVDPETVKKRTGASKTVVYRERDRLRNSGKLRRPGHLNEEDAESQRRRAAAVAIADRKLS